jgi:hypothetical protein
MMKISQCYKQNKSNLECIRDILHKLVFHNVRLQELVRGYSANGDFSSLLTKAELRFAGVVWAIYLNWLACVRSLSPPPPRDEYVYN